MPERRSVRTETEDESRVDHLLNLLSDLSQRDPCPDVRERLEALVAERLRDGARVRGAGRTQLAWLKPTFAAVLLAAMGLAAALVFHFRQHEPAQTDRTAKVSEPGISPAISQEEAAHIAPAAAASVTRQARIQRPHSPLVQTASTRRMIMQLPYSNSAIETGTYSTIRVSMSQSELLSLGFPINATLQDRRVAAELTLGDDGLPRAISLPLPLEVMKEKR
jgi:hypothetical protein